MKTAPGLGDKQTETPPAWWRASLAHQPSPPRRVALHAARIGGGLAVAAVARCRGEPAFGPGRPDLDHMAATFACLAGFRRPPALHHQYAGPRRARPERNREMLGVPGLGVDRLLEIEPGMN